MTPYLLRGGKTIRNYAIKKKEKTSNSEWKLKLTVAIILAIALISSVTFLTIKSINEEDNTKEVFELDFPPQGTYIDSSSKFLLCFGSKDFSTYYLKDINSDSYTLLAKSNLVLGKYETIVNAVLGDNIAFVATQSISQDNLKADSVDTSRLLMFSLDTAIGSLSSKPFTFSVPTGSILTNDLSIVGGKILFSVLDSQQNLDVFSADSTGYELKTTISDFVSSKDSHQLSLSEDMYAVLNMVEGGRIDMFDFESTTPVYQVYGRSQVQTNSVIGLGNYSQDWSIESVSLDTISTRMYCQTFNPENPMEKGVFIFKKKEGKFWTDTRGVFSRTVLQDQDSSISFSFSNNYFIVSYPFSLIRSPAFNIYQVLPSSSTLTNTVVSGFGSRFGSKSLFGLQMSSVLVSAGKIRIATFSSNERAVVWIDASIPQ
jgi:hypothetical protein